MTYRNLTVASMLLLAIGVPTASAQQVAEVTGTLAEGSLLTVVGSGFGDRGPTVVMFDDFEGGVNGSIIDARAAAVGEWSRVVSTGSPAPSAYYSNSSSVSGNLAFRSNQYNGVSRLDLDFGDQTELFGCWWIRHEGTGWPNNGGSPADVNWKTVWLWELPLGVAGGNDVVLPSIGGSPTNQWRALFGNRTGFGANIYNAFGQWDHNVWRRVAVYINIDGATGYGDVDFWTYAANDGPWHRTIVRRDLPFAVPGHTYRGLGMNGYAYAGNPDSHPMFDDFYWAVGEAAQARVELGDNQNYLNCNELAILVPESWSSTVITARMRETQFSAADNVYVFVVGADGTPSSGVLLDGVVDTNAPALAVGEVEILGFLQAADGTGMGSPLTYAEFEVARSSNPELKFVDPTISISGTASDDFGIVAITWANSLGGSGTVAVSENWSVAGIPCLSGVNRITVICRDVGGNTATRVASVEWSGPALPGQPDR